MIETGDWLVPHLWYLPHLDKPPMTYWLVAASMKLFGQNEWAARLPVALAGISGVWAAFLLGCSLGGRRAGFWSAVILQSSLLYFVMARMLTPDIFLTQFVAWAIYFFWRSWQNQKSEVGSRNVGIFRLASGRLGGHRARFFDERADRVGNSAGCAGRADYFPAKGNSGKTVYSPVLLPVSRCFSFWPRRGFWWFFSACRSAAHYMILGQAAGHLLGTTIKNRPGAPFYFFGILVAGLMPWTILLGWLWRRAHWRSLDARSKDGWLLLNVWAIFTFVLFSFSHAKLPAYILPIFPALAVLLALRFFSEERQAQPRPQSFGVFVSAARLLIAGDFSAFDQIRLPRPASAMVEMAGSRHGGSGVLVFMADAKNEGAGGRGFCRRRCAVRIF